MSRENDFINQWGIFGKTMLYYRIIAALAMVLILILTVTIIILFNQNPLVIVKDHKGNHEFYTAKRDEVSIKESDVNIFATEFIRSFYGDQSVHCSMTSGLQNKVSQQKNENIEQYVGAINIALEEKSTIVNFDLIVTIKDVPIVVRKEIELQIIQAKSVNCNPMGLYVNGIKERVKK